MLCRQEQRMARIKIYMKSLARAMGTACLFVGSVVGAGFATGREIALFFGGGSFLNLLIASLFMGSMAFLFSEMGAKHVISDERIRLGVDTMVSCCAFAVYAAMIASAESVLKNAFSVSGLSLFVVTVCLFLSASNIVWVSRLTAVAVPVLIALIAFVGVPAFCNGNGGELHPLRSLGYGAMNLLFSGALLYKAGERSTRNERILTAAISASILFFLLLCVFFAIRSSPDSEMPFLEAAQRAGLGAIVPPVLLLAIVTTMAGCEYLVSDKLFLLTKDRVFSCVLPAFFGILFARIGFSHIVETAYPVVSALGLLFSFVAPIYMLATRKPAPENKVLPPC